MRNFCTDGFPGGNHFQGVTQPDQTRQALGAAGAGDQTDLDLRLSEIHSLGRHAVVANHSDLQAAPQTVTIDGGYHRLRSGFNGVQKSDVVSEFG